MIYCCWFSSSKEKGGDVKNVAGQKIFKRKKRRANDQVKEFGNWVWASSTVSSTHLQVVMTHLLCLLAYLLLAFMMDHTYKNGQNNQNPRRIKTKQTQNTHKRENPNLLLAWLRNAPWFSGVAWRRSRATLTISTIKEEGKWMRHDEERQVGYTFQCFRVWGLWEVPKRREFPSFFCFFCAFFWLFGGNFLRK